MSTTTGRTSTRALALSGALLSSTFLLSAPVSASSTTGASSATGASSTAQVSTPSTTTPAPTARELKLKRAKAFGRRAVSVVSTRRGSSYSYGAVGPRRFDCSGLTMWTFRKLGRKLPHSSAAQYGKVKHLRAKDRRPGDLVFFHDGGGIYHVAIYAGHNQIWHAPYSGTRVRKDRIWTRSVYYGRVRPRT